ncbi:MAG: sugar ABC transporter permease, partial [Micrococcales bacterium]|nr:sugar ABC transporter permease [Micrococcales bacterium]
MTVVAARPRRRWIGPRSGPSTAGVPGRRRRVTARTRSAWIGLGYALPGLALFGYIVVLPLAQSVRLSLYHWDGVTTATWAGLGNYVTFFRQPLLRDSLFHVLVLVAFFALLPTALGLISAGLLGRGRIRGRTFFRVVIFVPQVLAAVVVAIVWGRVLGPDGPLNAVLRAVGAGALATNWLGSFTWALPALGIIGTWVSLGFAMVLFLAGVGSIPVERYEAARVDGAGPVREFFVVTLPGLRSHLAVALTLTVTGALRTFDLVWNTTRGGPGTS